MKIINTDKNTVIATDTELADTFFARMTGLLGRTTLKPNEALVITGCNSIHMFFMRFSIDAIFVGKDNRVVGLVSGIKPFQLSPIFWKACFVIEAPVGTILASRTQIDDLISL